MRLEERPSSRLEGVYVCGGGFGTRVWCGNSLFSQRDLACMNKSTGCEGESFLGEGTGGRGPKPEGESGCLTEGPGSAEEEEKPAELPRPRREQKR